MQLKVFKTLWGHEGSPQEAAQLAVEAGFSGIEAPAPQDPAAFDALGSALADQGLDYIAEICTAGSYVPDRTATPDQHLDSLAANLERSAPLQPLFCNLMTGCDAWPLEVQVEYFGRAQALGREAGMLLSFETHRGRSMFNPWVTRDILRAVPDIVITCDFSHWVVVCERLMDSEWDTIIEVARRAHHVHGRVGYDQGPQVPHPAAPEYADALSSHRRCWEAIWQAQIERDYGVTTMTPEFGPDGYLHCLPFTGTPVADLWQINRWMGRAEIEHFADFTRAYEASRSAA